jgi:hypothetical protein
MRETYYFLSDFEYNLIKSLAENPSLMVALKKILLFNVQEQGVLKPGEDVDVNKNYAVTFDKGQSDSEYGKRLRLTNEAFRIIGLAFDNIAYAKEIKLQEEDPLSNAN